MFEITLLTVGKLKEKFYLSAAAEYEKRLKAYCRFSIVELPETRLPDDPSPAEIAAGLEKEAALILGKLPKNAWFCVLTPEGKNLSSEALAEKMAQEIGKQFSQIDSLDIHLRKLNPPVQGNIQSAEVMISRSFH